MGPTNTDCEAITPRERKKPKHPKRGEMPLDEREFFCQWNIVSLL